VLYVLSDTPSSSFCAGGDTLCTLWHLQKF
jgi:hypothetical protein